MEHRYLTYHITPRVDSSLLLNSQPNPSENSTQDKPSNLHRRSNHNPKSPPSILIFLKTLPSSSSPPLSSSRNHKSHLSLSLHSQQWRLFNKLYSLFNPNSHHPPSKSLDLSLCVRPSQSESTAETPPERECQPPQHQATLWL